MTRAERRNALVYKAKVVFNKKTGSGLFHMRAGLKRKIVPLPGQFINILVSEGYEPLLRRPFSVFNASPYSVEIVYKVVGKGTELLSKKKKGALLDFVGPLGNSYLDFWNKAEGKKIIRVGGGTGAAAVYFLAKELKKKKADFSVIQGAACGSELVCPEKFGKLGCLFATEDGSRGKKGMVTEVLKKKSVKNSVVFACGPEPMLKAVRKVCGAGIKVYGSFEAYMGCGMGACLSCVIPVKAGKGSGFEYKRVCADGPVFDLEKVIFR